MFVTVKIAHVLISSLIVDLTNIIVRVYSVFICCCLAAFSASSAISSVHLLLSTLTCLLISLSFCRYSSCHLCLSLSDLAPINFCLMAFLWSTRAQVTLLNHGLFFFFLYPSTSSAFLHKLSPISRFSSLLGLLLLFHQSLSLLFPVPKSIF